MKIVSSTGEVLNGLSPEDAEDVAEAEVVVLLLGQLLLAQGVQHVELAGEIGEALGIWR